MRSLRPWVRRSSPPTTSRSRPRPITVGWCASTTGFCFSPIPQTPPNTSAWSRRQKRSLRTRGRHDPPEPTVASEGSESQREQLHSSYLGGEREDPHSVNKG